MACALLAAGAVAAAATALQSPRRSAAVSKGHPNEAACMDQHHQLHWKLPLLAAESHRSGRLVGCCCTGSGSSAEAATSSRSTYVSSSRNDVSMRDSVDAVPGGCIVISGYWIGPDMNDGCGHIQAVLQRIS